jgi:hypothetical protein
LALQANLYDPSAPLKVLALAVLGLAGAWLAGRWSSRSMSKRLNGIALIVGLIILVELVPLAATKIIAISTTHGG